MLLRREKLKYRFFEMEVSCYQSSTRCPQHEGNQVRGPRGGHGAKRQGRGATVWARFFYTTRGGMKWRLDDGEVKGKKVGEALSPARIINEPDKVRNFHMAKM
jgi:hypothetical protein